MSFQLGPPKPGFTWCDNHGWSKHITAGCRGGSGGPKRGAAGAGRASTGAQIKALRAKLDVLTQQAAASGPPQPPTRTRNDDGALTQCLMLRVTEVDVADAYAPALAEGAGSNPDEAPAQGERAEGSGEEMPDLAYSSDEDSDDCEDTGSEMPPLVGVDDGSAIQSASSDTSAAIAASWPARKQKRPSTSTQAVGFQ